MNGTLLEEGDREEAMGNVDLALVSKTPKNAWLWLCVCLCSKSAVLGKSVKGLWPCGLYKVHSK